MGWFQVRSTLLGSSGPPLRLGDETITASDHVRLLGVTISSDLSPVKHVGTISSSCFYWLRQIRRIRRSLDAESAKTLVHAFATAVAAAVAATATLSSWFQLEIRNDITI